METFFNYTIHIKFRNGKELVLFKNDLTIQKDNGSYKPRMWFDDKPQILILSGSPNIFNENEYYLYNCSPVKVNLFEEFPEDWDKTDEQFNVIDEVFVNTAGVIRHE